MSVLVLGINHNTATVAVREKVAFAPEVMQDALQQACARAGIAEIAILSTCNRTELYCVPSAQATAETRSGVQTQIPSAVTEQKILDWLCEYHHLTPAELSEAVYSYQDAEAVRHLMRVASGLDSMVLGEPQILGQIKSSFEVARHAVTVGSHLHRVFEEVFAVAKERKKL